MIEKFVLSFLIDLTTTNLDNTGDTINDGRYVRTTQFYVSCDHRQPLSDYQWFEHLGGSSCLTNFRSRHPTVQCGF